MPFHRLRSFVSRNHNLLIVAVCFLLLGATTAKSLSLRREVAACSVRQKEAYYRLDLTSSLMRLIGERLPLHDRLKALVPQEESDRPGHIVTVFNPTACGKCVREELAVVQYVLGGPKPYPYSFLGLLGADTAEDKNRILTLQAGKLLTFPSHLETTEELNRYFPVKIGERYTDTPIYFLVDSAFRVRSVFKPDQWAPGKLEIWLRSIEET